MPLRFHNTHGSYHVRIGAFVDVPALSGYTAFTVRDPIVHFLSGSYFDLNLWPIEPSRLVYYSRGEPSVVLVEGQKPSHQKYDGSLDYRRYGSFLDSAFAVGRIFGGRAIFPFEPGREHNVLHSQPSGDVGPSFGGDRVLNHIGDFEGVAVDTGYFAYTDVRPVFHEVNGVVNAPIYNLAHGDNTLSGWSYALDSPLATYAWAPRCDFQAVCEFIRDEYLDRTFGGHLVAEFPWGVWHESYTTSFVIEESDSQYVVKYHTQWTEDIYGSPKYTGWDTVITLPKVLSFPSAVSHDDGSSRGASVIYDGVRVVRTFTECAPNISDWFGPYHVGSVLSSTEQPGAFWFLGQPIQGSDASSAFSSSVQLLLQRRPWLTFRDNVQEVASDIRYSSFISTSDALSQATASLDTDVIQTLVKLPAISDQIPDVLRVVSGITKLTHGKVSGLKDLLDFLTEARLQHQFEWRSEYDLVSNLVPRMSSVLRTIDSLSSKKQEDLTFFGEYSYTFPEGTFGRPRSTLKTHSRVLVGASSFRSFESLLRLRSIGFTPGFSTVWDLIPFSFVANWFTGVGPRIRDLESVGLIAAMDVKCYTHSYRVVSPFTDSELALYGIKPSATTGSKTPELVVYVREVSARIPRLGVGRFDFRMPTVMPSWATVGSLAWQLFAESILP